MKLGPIHADRIEAFVGCTSRLSETVGLDTASSIVSKFQMIARQLIDAAPDDADPGRLTHALDSLREAMDAFDSAVDISVAKNKRMRRELEAKN